MTSFLTQAAAYGGNISLHGHNLYSSFLLVAGVALIAVAVCIL